MLPNYARFSSCAERVGPALQGPSSTVIALPRYFQEPFDVAFRATRTPPAAAGG